MKNIITKSSKFNFNEDFDKISLHVNCVNREDMLRMARSLREQLKGFDIVTSEDYQDKTSPLSHGWKVFAWPLKNAKLPALNISLRKKKNPKTHLQDQDIKYIGLRVRCDTKKQMLSVLNNIHKQLVGNKDYIESRIILNSSHDLRAMNNSDTVLEKGHCVYVWLFDGVTLPPLKVDIPKAKKKKVKKGDKKKK